MNSETTFMLTSSSLLSYLCVFVLSHSIDHQIGTYQTPF